MTRLMYDAITPKLCPGNGQLYAGYVGGKWPSYNEMVSRFPNAKHVSIAVNASEDAQVLDVERYDATPAQAPGWVVRQRARGIVPTVYCSQFAWGIVRAAFQAQGVPEPAWWIANYDLVAIVPAGAVAKQYRNTPGYDVSIVADYWPGVDSTEVFTVADVQAIVTAITDLQGALEHALGVVVNGDGAGVPIPNDTHSNNMKHLIKQNDQIIALLTQLAAKP